MIKNFLLSVNSSVDPRLITLHSAILRDYVKYKNAGKGLNCHKNYLKNF